MRLIDVDALQSNFFDYTPPEFVWDRGDVEHKIDEMPTIDAIPVEWLEEQADYTRSEWDYDTCEGIRIVLKAWQKEQEAR